MRTNFSLPEAKPFSNIYNLQTSEKSGAIKLMMQTVKAVIDEKGRIHFLEPVKLETFQHVLVTILPSSKQPDTLASRSGVTGLGEVLDDDLEGASREIAETFKNALNR